MMIILMILIHFIDLLAKEIIDKTIEIEHWITIILTLILEIVERISASTPKKLAYLIHFL